MLARVRPHLSFANAMSLTAVFIALGGSAYAALSLPKNSVGTKQLKNGAVTTKKLKNHAVTGAKIKLATLGTVPTAGFAASAGNALALGGQPTSAYLSASHVTTGSKVQTAANPAASADLLKRGPLTLTVYCYDAGINGKEVQVWATSTQNADMGLENGAHKALPANTQQLLDSIQSTTDLYKAHIYSYTAADKTAFDGIYALGVVQPAGDCVSTAHAIG